MLFQEWLIYAVIAVFCFGLINVLDAYFVGNGEVYGDEYEGMIISSLYKVVGSLGIGIFYFSKIVEISFANAAFCMLIGIIVSVAFVFYFFAVFYHNDLSLIQVYWNLTTPLVAISAWIFLGERLGTKNYIGILIVFLGAVIVSLSKNSFNSKAGKLFVITVPMIVLYTASEVLMKYVVDVRHVEFGQSFFFVCLGQTLFGLILLGIRWEKVGGVKFIKKMVGRHSPLFIFSESLELAALFFTQLAIVKTLSISLFGMMEAFMPVMVLLLTGASIVFLKVFGRGTTLKRVYDENMSSGMIVKIVATAIMMAGIFLVD